MKAFFSKYWMVILAIIVLIVALIAVFYSGKKSGSNNVKVVDDTGKEVKFSEQQKAEAGSIARRIYVDLRSGWLFGLNFSSILRDNEAYKALVNMSDTMFALTAQTYRSVYNSSMIADIRAESSLATGGVGGSESPKDIILRKAERLNIA